MNNPYDLHSWSTHYREVALRDAKERHLAKQMNTDRASRESGRLALAWRNSLALLRGA